MHGLSFRWVTCLACCFSLFAGGPAVSVAAPTVEVNQDTIDHAVERVYPSLVRIGVVMTSPSNGRLQKRVGTGSGVVIREDGYVITNHHVAGKGRRLICRLPDGEEIEAELIGTDPLADIAVLKLDLASRKPDARALAAVPFGDSDQVVVGDTVLAMGSPAALSQSVTKGIVSNAAMILPNGGGAFRLDGENVGSLVRWIGHDAVIFGGNSGGPLVNLEGEIIGINEVGIGSLGGAIPGNLAQSVAEQLIEHGEVHRSWTGLNIQPRLKDAPETRGILTAGIVPGSPAETAGLEPGDTIIQYDEVDVNAAIHEDLPPFNQLVLGTPIGKTVPVQVLRQGEVMSFKLTTEARESAIGDDEELKSWGMTARDFTRMSAKEMKRENKDGVLVHTLRQGGPCIEAKPPLRRGDVIVRVNDTPVRTVQELRDFTRQVTTDRDDRVPVLVRFERKTDEFLTVVKVGRESEQDKPLTARKAWLAVSTQVLTRELATALGQEDRKGVRIIRVYPGHEAEKAGLEVGDLLVALDGEPIDAAYPEDAEVLPSMIHQYRIGTEVTFTVLRGEKVQKVAVVLERPPKPPSEMKRYKNIDFEFSVRNLAFKDRADEQIEDEVSGVLVTEVEQSGWTALAGLRIGDVLMAVGESVTPDIKTVENLLEEARTNRSKRVTFFVQRGIHTRFLEVEPDWTNGADESPASPPAQGA